MFIQNHFTVELHLTYISLFHMIYECTDTVDYKSGAKFQCLWVCTLHTLVTCFYSISTAFAEECTNCNNTTNPS